MGRIWFLNFQLSNSHYCLISILWPTYIPRLVNVVCECPLIWLRIFWILASPSIFWKPTLNVGKFVLFLDHLVIWNYDYGNEWLFFCRFDDNFSFWKLGSGRTSWVDFSSVIAAKSWTSTSLSHSISIILLMFST